MRSLPNLATGEPREAAALGRHQFQVRGRNQFGLRRSTHLHEGAEEVIDFLLLHQGLDLVDHSDSSHDQLETAAAAFSPISVPDRNRAGAKGSISFGVLPVAISSAVHLAAIGAALKP